jgi:hypothetical protein
MAGAPDQQTPGGLSSVAGDPTKAPLYGEGSDEYLATIEQAQKDAIKALQDRYANPNWFKVAAGFAKPTGGNFLASLGNALEPLGENIEQERAQQLPIQELKLRIAQTSGLMTKAKNVNNEIYQWKQANPGKQVPEDKLQDWMGRAANSEGVQSLIKERDDMMKRRDLINKEQSTFAAQQQQDRDLAKARREAGAITPQQYMDVLENINTRNKNRPSGDINDLPTSAPDKSGKQPPDTGNLPPPPLGSAQPDASGKPKQVYKPSYVLPHPQALTAPEIAANETAKATATSVNAEPEAQFKALQKTNDPSLFPLAINANTSIQDAIKSDPKTFVKVTNLVRQQGGMANMLNKGLQMHFNGYGITVGVPIEAGLEGDLKPDELAYRDTLLSNLATSAYYNLLAQGIDPSKAGEGKFSQLIAREMNIDKAPKAIDHQIDLNIEQLKHSQRLYNAMSNGLPEAVSAGSLSPHYDVQNQSDDVKVANKMYQNILTQKSKEYHERLKGNKP